jgi:hypothetical protein
MISHKAYSLEKAINRLVKELIPRRWEGNYEPTQNDDWERLITVARLGVQITDMSVGNKLESFDSGKWLYSNDDGLGIGNSAAEAINNYEEYSKCDGVV